MAGGGEVAAMGNKSKGTQGFGDTWGFLSLPLCYLSKAQLHSLCSEIQHSLCVWLFRPIDEVWGLEVTGSPLNQKLLTSMTGFQLLHITKGYDLNFAEKYNLGHRAEPLIMTLFYLIFSFIFCSLQTSLRKPINKIANHLKKQVSFIKYSSP